MTAEERESLFEQMLDLPDMAKKELLIQAFANMECTQDDPEGYLVYTERFFNNVTCAIDKHMEGALTDGIERPLLDGRHG